jgi:hypothetical protein
MALWRRSFWRVVALVILIVAITVAMVRWFLLRPMSRVAERLRRLRIGHAEKRPKGSERELGLFSPLAREVETMAESLKPLVPQPPRKPACAKQASTCGPRSDWQCTCAIMPVQAASLWFQTASRICMSGRAARSRVCGAAERAGDGARAGAARM